MRLSALPSLQIWRYAMAAITINDRPTNRALDRQAMSSIRGANGAPWVFNAFQPFSDLPSRSGFGPVVNLYQVTNNFYAEQMINKSQTVNINNSGNNSNITAVLLSSLASS